MQRPIQFSPLTDWVKGLGGKGGEGGMTADSAEILFQSFLLATCSVRFIPQTSSVQWRAGRGGSGRAVGLRALSDLSARLPRCAATVHCSDKKTDSASRLVRPMMVYWARVDWMDSVLGEAPSRSSLRTCLDRLCLQSE